MNADPKKNSPTSEAEPTAAMTPMPVWPMALMLALLFLGGWYFDIYGGWFEAKVYAPYRSVADVQRFQPNTDPNASFVALGKKLFSENCAVCHMETGVGNPANGCPPLVDSEWVKHPAPERIIMLISKGLSGPITVNNKVYNTGVMLAVGDSLPGDEKEKAMKIAAIASYVRKQFGNLTEVVKPEQAQAVRAGIKDRTSNFTPEELLKVP
ncbi:MAG: c-type cytochrome [Verrucomicrobiota bacterium]